MLLDLVLLQEPYVYEIAFSDYYVRINRDIKYGKLIELFKDSYCITNYKFRQSHGIHKMYNINGKILKRYTYKYDVPHGRHYDYSNPNYITSGQYIKGLQSGLWKYKYPNGDVETLEYVDDRINGLVKWYYSSGALAMQGRQFGSNRDGKWNYFDINGHKNESEFYKAGNCVRKVTYHANGCKKLNTSFRSTFITEIEYDSNGHEINRKTIPYETIRGIFDT